MTTRDRITTLLKQYLYFEAPLIAGINDDEEKMKVWCDCIDALIKSVDALFTLEEKQ